MEDNKTMQDCKIHRPASKRLHGNVSLKPLLLRKKMLLVWYNEENWRWKDGKKGSFLL